LVILAALKLLVKKLASIFLLTSFFLNIIGYHVFFYLRQQELKSGMREYLHSGNRLENVTELQISVNDNKELGKLKWENDKEFHLNGIMFDVIEKRIENGKWIIRCISDKQETSLVKAYEKMNQDDPATSNRSTVLLKLINLPFIVTKKISLSSIKEQSNIFPYPYSYNISSYHGDILTPPPQLS
jgi:hypothetical protein